MTGAPVATGAITLDRDKAKDKLRRFQLADPCAWLLELVRAAVAQGASWVEVTTDADDVRVAFDGRAFSAVDVRELYEALLARGAPPGRQHLAVALNGAMALGPRFVELVSTDRHGAVSLRLSPTKPDTIKNELGTATPHQTTVWLRHPFRMGAFLEFFRARLGTQREIGALRRGCRFLGVPVGVNGELVSARQLTPGGRAIASKHTRNARVFAVSDDEQQPHGLLVFTFRGVVLEEVRHPLLPQGLVAVLPSDHLTRDASLGAFVRDSAWHELVDAALVAALALCEDEGRVLLKRAARALGPAVLGTGDPRQLEQLPRLHTALKKVTRALCREHVLTAVDGDPISIAQLHAVLSAGRPVPMSSRISRVPRRGDPIVRVDGEDALARLQHYVGRRLVSGDELVDDAERRHRGLRRLHERASPLALAPGELLGRAQWSVGAMRGITGISAAGTRLRVTLFTDGCMIGTHSIDSPLPGLTIAVEAPFTLTAECTDAVRDQVFARALRAAFAAVPDALADACGRARNADALARRALPLLAWALDPESLWARLAVAAGCPLVDDQPPLPPMPLQGADRHPVCATPCLPRVDGTRVALDDVRGRTVPVVPPDIEAFSHPEAIRSGDVLRAVLARVARTEVLDELARREATRARLLAGPATLRAPYPPAVGFRVGDVASGWIAFGGARPGITLEAHVEGRALLPTHFRDAQLGSLRVVVDDPLLLPLADGTIAAADAKRLVRAGLAAAGGLLETAAGGPGVSRPGRSLALTLLAALAPTEALARAVVRLGANDYLALRALSLAAESSDLEPLIELALEAGALPTVSTVRELAKAAGAKLPKRGATDADPRAFVLAPLGGLRGLRETDRTRTLRERVLERLPAIASLELRALDGTVVLRTLLDQGAPLAYVPAGWLVPEGADPTGRVLTLTTYELSALRALLGPAALENAVPELRERAARRAHQAKPVEQPRLDRGLHLGVTELALEGARGELGLLPPIGPRPAAHVRLLSNGRFVKRLDVSGAAPCSFAAVVEDPALPVVLDDPAGAARAGRIAAECVAAAERVLDGLVATLAAERPDARVRACLLERLSLHPTHGIELQRLGRLSQAPLLDLVDGRCVSFDGLLAELQRNGPVACVATVPQGAPPRELVVVLPASHHRELLARAGVPLEDVTALWQKHHERQAALADAPPLPEPPADAYALGEANIAGVCVRLWVRPTTRGALLAAGLLGRQVGVGSVASVLPTVEGTVAGDSIVDPTVRSLSLALAWPAIDIAVTALATNMVARLSQGAGVDDLRRWCRGLSLHLAAAPDAHGKRLGPLLARLRALPLFDAPDGARLSLDQVLATRPARYEDELVAAGLAPAPVVADAPAPAPAPAPTPDEQLLGRLRELVALLALDDETQAQLGRWPILLVRRKGRALVRFTRTHCEVDLDHELGRAALGGDGAALDLLAAVLVGTANHHLDEIDARHEREFLTRLLALAATRGT